MHFYYTLFKVFEFVLSVKRFRPLRAAD